MRRLEWFASDIGPRKSTPGASANVNRRHGQDDCPFPVGCRVPIWLEGELVPGAKFRPRALATDGLRSSLGGKRMSNHGTKLEQLLNKADEYDLLSKLSPDPKVRAQSAKLAAEYRERAAKITNDNHAQQRAS